MGEQHLHLPSFGHLWFRWIGEHGSIGMLISVRAPTPITELKIGELFAERYTLVELLGRGGTSVAHRADDQATGRTVALKLLDARGDDARTYLLRDSFEREYHTLKQLAHPRVVQAWDYGVWRRLPYFQYQPPDNPIEV